MSTSCLLTMPVFVTCWFDGGPELFITCVMLWNMSLACHYLRLGLHFVTCVLALVIVVVEKLLSVCYIFLSLCTSHDSF